MGIFDRMGRAISSNLNALLDKAEDDGKLIELNLEDMAQQLKQGRQDVIAAVAAEKQLRKRETDLEAEVATWEKRAELALKSHDEALAREALKQKRRVADEAAAAQRARIEQRDVALQMKSELDRMETKLEELKLRKGSIVARAQQARAGSTELGARGGSSAFDSFRAMEEKIEGREQQALAMAEIEDALGGPQRQDLEARFRELEHGLSGGAGDGKTGSPEIEDELAALKKRIRL